MRSEQMEREILALYNVGEIQKYIFKSNSLKEIIGASALAANIIIEGLRAYIQDKVEKSEQADYMTDWEFDDSNTFLKDERVQMQVIYVWGCNAYVLFRTENVWQNISRFLAKYILDKTYSLTLTTAALQKSQFYKADCADVFDKMMYLKLCKPSSLPMGALPFMLTDTMTWYPVTYEENGLCLCTEAKLKRMAYSVIETNESIIKYDSQKMLAICHIKDNSIEKRMQDALCGTDDYEQSIRILRLLLKKTKEDQHEGFQKATKYISRIASNKNMIDNDIKYRMITADGDNIIFLCRPEFAIQMVKYYLGYLGTEKKCSASGGIAFFDDRVSFQTAYSTAQSCLESARMKAIENSSAKSVEIDRNYFDFQICTNISEDHLNAYRSDRYLVNGHSVTARPYYVPLKKQTSDFSENGNSVENLEKWILKFQSILPDKRNMIMKAIMRGRSSLEEATASLALRGYDVFKDQSGHNPIEESTIWFDALELMEYGITGE